jgi:serine/threonine-protein kinase
MATVYLAEDERHRRKVAVKVLRPDIGVALGAERFLREIELVATLSHPHILPLYDSGAVSRGTDGSTDHVGLESDPSHDPAIRRAPEFLYYVMPFVEGGTLRDHLAAGGPLPVDQALYLVRQVADALAYAHRQNVIHRDIKPENVLISEGHALLADFGIGKAVCDVCPDDISGSSAPIGTPAYMSPEQVLGEAIDGRSDVYSLACVLYELLTGVPPFQGPTTQSVLMKHVTNTAPSVRDHRPDVPVELDQQIQRALAKGPRDRFANAADLGAALGGSTTAVVRATAPVRRFAPRRWVAAAALALLAVVGWWTLGSSAQDRAIRSIAVLPLADLSEDSAQRYFVAGMHDALIAEIARLGNLAVISRTSVLQYEGTTASMPEIARRLGVDAVLEGSVLRHGDSVRVVAQLVAVDPERHVWSGIFDRAWRDLLTLHTDVAEAVARGIDVEFTQAHETYLATARSLDPGLLDAYLRGRFHTMQGSVAGFRAAVEAFEDVIAADPDFAPAHSGLALATHLLGFFGGVPELEAEPKAKAAAERAVALDPNLAEPRAVLAGIRSMFEWDWAGAQQDYELAVRLAPSSSIARRWYAYHLSAMGRHAEGQGEAQRGVELDPLNPFSWFVLADQFLLAREYRRAADLLGRALSLDPGMERASATLEDVYTLMGRYDDAVDLRSRRLEVLGDTLAVTALEARFRQRGPQGYWEWRLDWLQRLADTAYVPPREFTKVLAALGRPDEALRWLDRAYEVHDGMELLRVSPFYDALRGLPQFEAMVRRLAFPVAVG